MEVEQADVLKWAAWYSGPKFHALIADPPYEMKFMGKDWDGKGVSFQPSTWAALAEHLLPGAFGMAFASARGFHRLAVAIEDAGLIIHPAIFGWAYGSGFPKATRIDTQIDKANGEMGRLYKFTAWMRTTGLTARQIDELTDTNMGGHYLTDKSQPAIPTACLWEKLRPYCGQIPAWVDELVARIEAEREVIGTEKTNRTEASTWGVELNGGRFKLGEQEYDITAPATPLAQAWAGHRYGLQALKPALEPIIVFQKPYEGRPVECITETGAGALWIEGSRIGTESTRRTAGVSPTTRTAYGNYAADFGNGRVEFGSDAGRWPANFILDATAAERLDEMSGVTTSSNHIRHNTPDGVNKPHSYGRSKESWETGGTADSGGASRFFFRYQADALDEADPVYYCAKASRRERDAGLEDGKLYSMDEVSGGGGYSQEYQTKYQARKSARHNPHPTVKPIALARYLATLLLPPAEYAPRRILCPFAGAGSEMVGAMQAGWEEVTGIEMEMEYCDIARARLEYWANQKPAQIEMVLP